MLTREEAIKKLESFLSDDGRYMPPYTALSDIEDIISLLKQQPEQAKRKPKTLLSIFDGSNYSLVAICTDGTMWRVEGELGWVQIQSIPQDDKNE